jgi:DNA-binding transcriptional MerR regulator
MNYTSKTVSAVTGLSIRQIDYWDRTHFIKPSVREASGYGSLRLYSFNDLVQLRVARTIIDMGVSLQKMRKSIIYLKKHMPEIKKPLLELRFLTDGQTIFVLTGNEKKIIDTLKSGQLVFSVALGKIVEDIKGNMLTFQKDRKYVVSVKGKQYPVILSPERNKRRYRAECALFKGCVSRGETIEESLEAIKHAIRGHLDRSRNTKQSAIRG